MSNCCLFLSKPFCFAHLFIEYSFSQQQHRNLENSGKYINIQKSQAIEVECLSECTGELSLEWHLRMCTDEASVCTPVPKEELASMISTAVNGSMFYTSKPGIYKPNQWYLVVFRAYRTADVYGEASHRFFVNQPPVNGKD